jgi:LacI family transcriptional regulator
MLLTGVLRTLRIRRLVVGRDIDVISCDDPLPELFTPPVTVIGRDIEEMGRLAAQTLLRRMDDVRAGPETIILPTELILRSSTHRLS